MTTLLEKWASWVKPADGHNVHPDDAPAISALPKDKIAPYSNWSDYIYASDFGRDDKQLHLQLMPIPFLGDVASAKVIVLLQNPGFAPGDCHAEFVNRDFPRLLEANLKQDFRGSDYPFLFLDPELAWHTGFTWWHRKLQPVIEEVAKTQDVPLRDARRAVARHLAAIELLPYHSRSGVLSQVQLNGFESVRWARDHVRAVLGAGGVDVIAMRHGHLWDPNGDFDTEGRWCRYDADQARAATLRPSHTNGGGNRVVNAIVEAMRNEA